MISSRKSDFKLSYLTDCENAFYHTLPEKVRKFFVCPAFQKGLVATETPYVHYGMMMDWIGGGCYYNAAGWLVKVPNLFSQLKRPAQKGVFCDSYYTVPESTDYRGSSCVYNSGQRISQIRHNSTNFTFADGHAENISIPYLNGNIAKQGFKSDDVFLGYAL